jgi:prefoldin subunit 5
MTEMGEAAEIAVPSTLRQLEDQLGTLMRSAEREMESLGRDFEGLASATTAILESAGQIVGCAEGERMALMLPEVQKLSAAAKLFIRDRLEASSGILDTVIAEDGLLKRLSDLTRGQKAIVRETEMLRVLTNIEVARLGDVGAGFQYLAHELDDFSQSVARSTGELTSHTQERRRAISETRRSLGVELPEMRQEYARIEVSLDDAMTAVDATLGELRQTPARFRNSVQNVAEEIAGVVAAVQAHDITRQQMEHVQDALGTIAAALESGDAAEDGALRAGLAIQAYQLRNIRVTVDGWLAQIRRCLEGIARIASAEILRIGPMMLNEERALSSQLARVERLEEECEAGDARVQASFSGITGLMQLVSEHLERSKSVRDRLQLLMFNSIIEASHLGTQADGILEISTTIKRISASWGEITAQSEAAAQEIQTLVEQSRATLETFSEGGYGALREARSGTKDAVRILGEAARCAASRGMDIEAAVQMLKGSIAEIGGTGDRLEMDFRWLTTALQAIEAARQQLSEGGPPCDAAELERRFSAPYTTEIERAVLRAALRGDSLPAAQSFSGNSVELF